VVSAKPALQCCNIFFPFKFSQLKLQSQDPDSRIYYLSGIKEEFSKCPHGQKLNKSNKITRTSIIYKLTNEFMSTSLLLLLSYKYNSLKENTVQPIILARTNDELQTVDLSKQDKLINYTGKNKRMSFFKS
jgi:hypothetical protein